MTKQTDIEIMQMLYRDNPTIPEIAKRVGKSWAYVHGRLVSLEQAGMVKPPRKPNAARDRTLTEQGERYLEANGYIPIRVFEEP